MARRCWELQVKVGWFGSPAVGTDIGPATPAGPEGIRFVVALHHRSTVRTSVARISGGLGAKPESTMERPWGQPLNKPVGVPLNLG